MAKKRLWLGPTHCSAWQRQGASWRLCAMTMLHLLQAWPQADTGYAQCKLVVQRSTACVRELREKVHAHTCPPTSYHHFPWTAGCTWRQGGRVGPCFVPVAPLLYRSALKAVAGQSHRSCVQAYMQQEAVQLGVSYSRPGTLVRRRARRHRQQP